MTPSAATGPAAALAHTLAACVPVLRRHCADPWIVIGSAAAWLVGAPVQVADLDVLTSARDARSLAAHWRERLLATEGLKDADRFRSHFSRFAFPLPVEVMGDLEVATPDGWQPVCIDDIRMARMDGIDVPVPTVAAQVRLLERFGRPKDRLRAELLKSLAEFPA